MKAQDIMTKDVVTVRPEMTVHQIATLMARKHISGLPVVSKDGDVLGIISESDLIGQVVKFLVHPHPDETLAP